MVEESIVFLTSIQLPKYCFVSEAVEWLALGRVPEAQWTEDRNSYDQVEYRFYWREMPDNFEPSYIYPWFERPEFEDLGIPIVEDYFVAAQKCFDEDLRHLPERILQYEGKETAIIEREDGTTYDLWQSQIDTYRKTLAELGPLQALVDRVEAQFRSPYEVAWAKLFQLLARGEIECTAIDLERWESLSDDGKYEEAARFEQIAPTSFTLNFDWSQNRFETRDRKFVTLRVRTDEILKYRNFLLPKGKAMTLERFGASFATKGADKPVPRQRRGRPHELNWDEIKNHLSNIIQENSIPVTKESCIYELIAYAEKKFGKSPSRSSVQRNLSAELSLIYAQK